MDPNHFQLYLQIKSLPNLYFQTRPVGLIAPPFTIGFLATENLPKVKSGQVEVGLNIAQKHSSRF